MRPPAKSLEFCRRALEDRDSFWAEQAAAIHWHNPFAKVCDYSKPPFVKWFVGGETNLCYNAVDRHLKSRGSDPALHYLSTEIDVEHCYTFRELHEEVCQFATVLRALGLVRGDRVLIEKGNRTDGGANARAVRPPCGHLYSADAAKDKVRQNSAPRHSCCGRESRYRRSEHTGGSCCARCPQR